MIGTASPKEKQAVGRYEETEDKQNTLMETEQTNLEKTKESQENGEEDTSTSEARQSREEGLVARRKKRPGTATPRQRAAVGQSLADVMPDNERKE